MLKPTVGRIVYYREGEGVRAAIISHVWDDACVNLMVIDQNGNSFSRTIVVQGAEAYQWDWMPYQKAKAEGRAET